MAGPPGRGAYKLNGAAAPAAPAARAPAAPPGAAPPAGAFQAALEAVRGTPASGPAGLALAACGGTLAAAGAAWALLSFVLAHPCLLCIVAGLALAAASLALRPEGALVLLPARAQDFLLRTTVFDLIYDDVAVQNAVRRWGRLLLLCAGDFTPGDVQGILAGIDPAFVDSVFRRTFFWWLPAPVRAALLPRQADAAARRAQGAPEARLAEAAGAGVGSLGLPADLGGPALTPRRIAGRLREMAQARAEAIVEPDLGVAIHAILGLRPVLLRLGASALQKAWGALTAASVAFLTCAAALGAPAVRGPLLRGAAAALARCGAPEALRSAACAPAGRAAGLAAALGGLSAGAAVAVAAAAARVRRLREELPPPPDAGGAGAPPAAGPSEGALRKRIQELEAQLAYQQESHEAALAAAAAHRGAPAERAAQAEAAPIAAGAGGAGSSGGGGPAAHEGLRRRPVGKAESGEPRGQ